MTIKTRTISGTEEGLKKDDHVYRRGARMGAYDKVVKAKLEELAGKEGYRFVDDTTMDLRLYSHRSRLYEVLPSVLLGLVDLTPYSTRMAVPRRSIGDEVVLASSKGEHVAAPGFPHGCLGASGGSRWGADGQYIDDRNRLPASVSGVGCEADRL